MRVRRTAMAVALATAIGVSGATAMPVASAGTSDDVKVITRGLDGPFGIDGIRSHGFVVAENVSGEVTWVNRFGRKLVLLDGVPGVAGVAADHGKIYSVLGGGDETGEAPEGTYEPSAVLKTDFWTGRTKVLTNLLDYELAHNPDGQVQFVDGHPVDALSNPFSANLSKFGLLIADGGANDVIRVNPVTGKPSTFFVPKTVTDVPACLEDGAQANPGTVGCDPVPTGIAVKGDSVYVSTLGAEVPGAGRVYKLNGRTGAVQRVWKGLTAPTGIAIGPSGGIFVSEVLYGAPEDEGDTASSLRKSLRKAARAADFDPSDVGRITKIDKQGKMTHAQVTMPTGMMFRHGHLYASAWSIAFFLGIEHAGQVVKVPRAAFH